MNLVWITDPHFDHVSIESWDRWVRSVRKLNPAGLLITGDISEGDDVVIRLQQVASVFEVPLYFVLGNHDFYQSSIARTRQQIIAAGRDNAWLHYLTDASSTLLDQDVYLVGDDGWGDATVGDYEKSLVRLNDFALIDDFRLCSSAQWKQILREQGSQSAARLKEKLLGLPENAKKVLIATHVPPFAQACWYQGRTTDEHWAPFFVCGAVGEVLMDICLDRPDCDYLVLCGHTHHSGVARMADNLIIYTGAAEYGHPAIASILEIGPGKLVVRAE